MSLRNENKSLSTANFLENFKGNFFDDMPVWIYDSEMTCGEFKESKYYFWKGRNVENSVRTRGFFCSVYNNNQRDAKE